MKQTNLDLENKMVKLKQMGTYRVFDTWRAQCTALWNRRGLLLGRFVRICKEMVQKRITIAKDNDWVDQTRAFNRKKAFFTNWTLSHHDNVYYRRRAINMTSESRFRFRRTMKGALTTLMVCTATIKRRQFCFEAAMSFYSMRMQGLGFGIWRRDAQRETRRRKRIEHKMYRQGMDYWQRFTSLCRSKRQNTHTTNQYTLKNERTQLKYCLFTWHQNTIYKKRLAYVKSLVKRNHRRNDLSLSFISWRCKWNHIIFTRMQDNKMEAARNEVMINLKSEELADLERNRDELKDLTASQKDKMEKLQIDLDSKEKMLHDSTSALEARRVEKKVLQKDLEDARRELRLAENARLRLESVEKMLLEERTRESESVILRKNELEAVVRTLRSESSALQADARAAQMKAEHAESASIKSISKEQKLLHDSENATMALESLMKKKEDIVHNLGIDQLGLQKELEKMQERLSSALKDGFSEINDADNQLRSRTSEIRVITSDSSLMEARNDELRRIIQEEEDRLEHLSRVDKSHKEAQELQELQEYGDINKSLDNSVLTASMASMMDMVDFNSVHSASSVGPHFLDSSAHMANRLDDSLEGSVYHTHKQVEELTKRLNSMGDVFQ